MCDAQRLGQLAAELAEKRCHACDLANRLDQVCREQLADAKRHRAELDALRGELAAERGRPWWRRMRRR